MSIDNDETAFTPKFGLFNNLKFTLPITVILVLVGFITGIQRTILSLYTKDVGGTGQTLGTAFFIQITLTIGTFGLMKAIADTKMSKFADVKGRRTMMLAGALIVVIGSGPMALIKSYWVLPVGNAFIGFGQGILFSAAMASLTDLSGAKQRAMALGLMELSVYGGTSLGSITAGFMAEQNADDFFIPFFVALIIGIISLVIGYFTLKETQTLIKQDQLGVSEKLNKLISDQEHIIREVDLSPFKSPTIIASYFMGNLARSIDALMIIILPLFLILINDFSTVEMSIVASSFTIMWALGMPLFGRLSDQTGRKLPVLFGGSLQATSLILIPFMPNLLWLIVISGIGGIGCSLYYPVLPSISVDIAPPEIKTQIIGRYRAALDSGYVVGPFILAIIAWISYSYYTDTDKAVEMALTAPFFVFGGLQVMIVFFFLFFVRETRPAWVQHKIAISHAEKIQELTYMIDKSVNKYLDGVSGDEYEIILAELKQVESQADTLEEMLSYRIYQRTGAQPAPDDYEFLKITTILERVAGRLLHPLQKLSVLPVERIPIELHELLREESKGLCRLMDAMVTCYKLMSEHLERVIEGYVMVDNIEAELDVNYRKLWNGLVKQGDTISPTT
ncbi:MAG: MFS transporter, partial [Candidatus Heimdallarchaeota archaeon]|nr:MFS transporter [Candidatus Heimdallarchaeota archaeon]MCK5049206.1 MFS transporter [Candidatus Heimdallarchaeota archaeon]